MRKPMNQQFGLWFQKQFRRTHMNGNIGRLTIAMLSFAVLLAGVMPAAHAATCSTARAAGTYGFATSGSIVGIGPRVSAGIITLDAAGNVTGKATSSLNGVVAGETFSGTYTVNSDCTGAFNNLEIRDLSGTLLLTVTADAAWDDNMREIRGVFTSASLPDGTPLPNVISVEGRKLVP
jgi:hypothetical protein